MEGMENYRRIKHNNIRIIFSKWENNEIVINKIGFRWDVYK
jgi:mRNA-degrading endonuclease RelE of RelBE toxin-antitoxin system